MESNMVDFAETNIILIKRYFLKHFTKFKLDKEYFYSPYWSIRFSNDDLKIVIEGDIGFMAKIVIGETEYPLWQFDRSVVNKTETNEENILFVLGVIKDFLDFENE